MNLNVIKNIYTVSWMMIYYVETSKGWKLVSEVLDCENFNDEYFY